MGQFAVISVVAALFLGAVLLLNAQLSTEQASDELSAYQTDRLAREAIRVGMKAVERNLNRDIDDWDLWTSDPAGAQARFGVPATPYGGGTYSVAIDSFTFDAAPTVSDKVWVTGVGSYDGWSAALGAVGTTEYTVKAVYEKGLTDQGVPPSFAEAIVSDKCIDMRGNIQISGGVHANDCLTSSGGSFDVYGTGTYTGSESTNDSRFTGGVAQSDSIYLPTVDIPPDSYTYQATGTPYNLSPATGPADSLHLGWNTDPGTGTLITGYGTQADPYVLYVNGNLNVTGDVRLVGYTRIYVNGTVDFGGNAKLIPTYTPAGSLPNPNQDVTHPSIQSWVTNELGEFTKIGIYATGRITLDGTVLVAAHLYSDSNVRYTGGGHKLLIGGVTTWEPMDVRGNAKIFYTTPSRTIEDPGINKLVPEGVRLIAYREWADRP